MPNLRTLWSVATVIVVIVGLLNDVNCKRRGGRRRNAWKGIDQSTNFGTAPHLPDKNPDQLALVPYGRHPETNVDYRNNNKEAYGTTSTSGTQSTDFGRRSSVSSHNPDQLALVPFGTRSETSVTNSDYSKDNNDVHGKTQGQNGQNFNRQTAPMGEFQNQRAQSGGGGAYNVPYRGDQTAYQTPPNGQMSFNPNSAGHNGQQQQQYQHTDPNDHQLRRTQSQSSMSSSNGMRDDVQLFEHFGCNENSADRVCRQNCRKNIPGYKVTCHPVDKINKKTIPVQFCLCLRVPFNGRALSGDQYGVAFNGRSDGMYTGDQAYQSNAQGYPSNTQSNQYGRSNSVGDQPRSNNNQRDQRRSMSNSVIV